MAFTSRVVKRNGKLQDIDLEKILKRIRGLAFGLSPSVVPDMVAHKVIAGVVDGIKTEQLDELAADIAANLAVNEPDYSILAGRLAASNLAKQVPATFSTAAEVMHKGAVISDDVIDVVRTHSARLDAAIRPERDLTFTIHAVQTMKHGYLMRVSDEIVETPQYMWMRVALGICGDDVDAAIEVYDDMSTHQYIHSSPTLFNAGTRVAQMASCFLVDMKADSIDGIYDTVKECALISKMAGGIGFNAHKIRSTGSLVQGTHGKSTGITKMLKVFDATMEYVNQGGKRRGSAAIYLEPHHADFMAFLDIRKAGGAEELRARGLFTAVWMSDLFVYRVRNNMKWSFFDPKTAPGLDEVYDSPDEKPYTTLYERYEAEGKARATVDARTVWMAILDSQLKTGTPYLLSKDRCNATSNQKNLGTIKSSNLCAEIVQYSSPDETAVCNLASINLSKFVEGDNMNYTRLAQYAGKVVANLNRVIDRSHYPTESSARSNTTHRPVGLGVSGLQDVFFKLQLPFGSSRAREVNRRIFESIYYGAVRRSVELARTQGPYGSFNGSPASKGIFNWEMWGASPDPALGHDWDGLRSEMLKFGLRNSLLVALMPTASSATLMNVRECFEAQTSNIYKRKVLSGEFVVANQYLARDLDAIGMWDSEVVNNIIKNKGSVQQLRASNQATADRLTEIKEIYKTVWEHSMKTVIDMAADRQPWVDQSQSMNLFLEDPTSGKLNAMYLYAHEKKLKTLVYYLRQKPRAEAIQFTVQKRTEAQCTEDICLSCQS